MSSLSFLPPPTIPTFTPKNFSNSCFNCSQSVILSANNATGLTLNLATIAAIINVLPAPVHA